MGMAASLDTILGPNLGGDYHAVLSGQETGVGEAGFFSLSLTAGESLIVNDSSTVDPYMNLWGPAGTVLAATSSALSGTNDAMTWQIPLSGTYVLELDSQDGSAGTHDLTIDITASGPALMAETAGDTNGTFAPGGPRSVGWHVAERNKLCDRVPDDRRIQRKGRDVDMFAVSLSKKEMCSALQLTRPRWGAIWTQRSQSMRTTAATRLFCLRTTTTARERMPTLRSPRRQTVSTTSRCRVRGTSILT